MNISVSNLTTAQASYFNNIPSNKFTSTKFIQVPPLSSVQQNGLITLQITGSAYPTTIFRVKNIEYISDTDYIWYGQIDETLGQSCPDGDLFIQNKNGSFIANIRINEEVYEICDLGGQKMLGKVSPTIGVGTTCEPAADPSGVEPPPVQTTGPGCVVRVLILYTNEAKEQAIVRGTNIESIALSNFNYTRQVLSNSALSNDLLLANAGIELWPGFDETGLWYSGITVPNIISELQASGTTTGSFVNTRKIATKADLVILLVRENVTDQDDGSLGVAYLAPTISSFGFGVSWADNNGIVFAHEMGHLFGGNHQPCPSPDPCAGFGTNRAHAPLPQRKTCVWGAYRPSEQIANYSNPNVNTNFFGFQIPTGTATRDNAKSMRNRACLMSGFSPEPQLFAHINAVNRACADEDESASVFIFNAPPGNITYAWQKSTDGGISFGSVFSTGIDAYFTMPLVPNSLTLKLTVTFSTGQQVVLFKTINTYWDTSCYRNNKPELDPVPGLALSLHIQPNPSTGFVEFEASSPVASPYTFLISDVKGATVKQTKGYLESGRNTFSAQLAELPTGVYQCLIKTESSIATTTLSIIK